MKIEDLKTLLQTEEVLSNPTLKEDLENLFNENSYSYNDIYCYPLSVSVDTYKYLLQSHNLDTKLFFTDIIKSKPGEKHDQLLDLALSKAIDWSLIYSLPVSISIADLEKCFDKGLTLNQAAKLVLGYHNSSTDIENLRLLEELTKYLGDKGANFSDFYSVPSYFSKGTYEYMLEHSLKAELIFKMAINLEPRERRDQLLDLALSKPIDWSSVSLPSSVSTADLEKCFDSGLTLNQAAKLVLDNNYAYSSNNENIAFQENLIKYLSEKGANFSNFNNIQYFSKETYEYMLEHGLKADFIFSMAINLEPGERRDQLLDLALSKPIDWSSMYSLPSYISIVFLEKCFDNGLTLNQAAKLVLGYYNSSRDIKNIERQEELVRYLGDKGANFSDFYSVPSYFSKSTYEYMLEHGSKAQLIFKMAIELEPGEKHDQLLDLALSKPIDWSSVSLPSSISVDDLGKCFDKGLTLNLAAKLVLDKNYSSTDIENLRFQEELIKYLIERGANFSDIHDIPGHFSKETYEYMLEHGLKAELIFKMAIDLEPGERHDQLLDLALSNNIDWPFVSLPSSISVDDLGKCFDKGLTLNQAAKLVLAKNYNSTEIKNIELQEILIKYLGEKGANFSDSDYVPKYFSKETYEYMLERGLKAQLIFKMAIELEPGEKHDQLLDLAFSKTIDWSSIYYLPASISITDLEKCFDNGLTLNQAAKLVLSYNYSSTDIENLKLQEELAKYLGEKGANFSDAYYVPKNFSKKTYEYMLEHGLKAELIFKMAIDLEPGERHDQLLDLALSKTINWSSINSLASSISIVDLEKCFSHGLSLEILIKNIFNHLRKGYSPDNVEYSEAKLTETQIEILDKAKSQGIDINKIFDQVDSRSTTTDTNGQTKPYVIPEKILEVLVKDYTLDSNLILEYGIINKVADIVKLALANNADVNYKKPGEDFSLFTKSLFTKNIEMVDLLIEHGAKFDIVIEYYVGFIKSSSFNFLTQVMKKLPELYDDEQLYEIFRSHGSSEAETRDFLDYHDLIKEYLLAKEGKETSLNKLEMDILDGNISLDNIAEYKDAQLTNKYGYGLLHLSIISDQYNLASKLVKDGVDVYAKTHNSITPLQLLSSKENGNLKELAEAIIEKIDNIDISLGSGETLTDILIQNKELEEKVIELTADSLFHLFKKDVDLFAPSNDLSKTNIAISHGDGFWSTGMWSTARIISQNYPNVKVYLVKDNMLEKGGEAFLKQFDAVINPGAGDSYPSLEEFTKADCPFNMSLEKHYQTMLELSDQHNIPYLGMCAGAQHFAMYHGGALKPLDGYNRGQHQVKYIAGTNAYFMALTKIQQKEALQNCELPEVEFKGDTAHHYAAVNDKLGHNMELGAVSEDNVAMSYAHVNGIRYATQFHPEHHYDNFDNNNTINQKAWINNFVELAQIHHEFRVNGDKHPTEHFIEVKARLTECLTEPTCLAEDSLASYQELYY